MTHHPHVHMIVSGGGISPDGSTWLSCRRNFFLPVRVLSRLFRRLFLEKLVEAYGEGRLNFFGQHAGLSNRATFGAFIKPLRKSEWVVYAKPPFGAPKPCSPKALQDLVVLTVVPLAPHRAVAWVGHKDYSADWQTLAFAIFMGLRIDLVREDKEWRISYLPLVRSSAGKHDAIGAAAPPGAPVALRKELLNRIFAYNDLPRQKAIWSPIDRG